MNQSIFLALRVLSGLIRVCSAITLAVLCVVLGLLLGYAGLVFVAGAYVLDGMIALYRQVKKLFSSKAK